MPEIVGADGLEVTTFEDHADKAPEPQDELALIEAANRALIDEIHALGGQIPPVLLQQIQIDMLIDLLWPQGSVTRKLYDTMLEDRLTGVLEHIKQATIRGRLTEGIHG